MVDFDGNDDTSMKYLCPSDRQLALRAKLHTGWSSGKSNVPLQPEEKEAIISVIRRNEMLEVAERQRVGKLVEKVEKIKGRAAEYGPRYCRLCGQSFGLLGPSKFICDDCRKPVCSKCSIELNSNFPQKKEVWLCKICSETREMWKKTGAWFFKGLPCYELPKEAILIPKKSEVLPHSIKTTKLGMQLDESSSEEDEEDSPPSNIGFAKNVFALKLKNSISSKYVNNESNISCSKSPVTVYSRQTSSSESQKSGNSNLHNIQQDWDNLTVGGHTRVGSQKRYQNQRRGSISSSWSLSESSSGNDSNVTINPGGSKEPGLGWLELTVHYDETSHTLEVIILRARDLPEMDNLGLADPFCKINILQPSGELRHVRWMKTKTAHKTRNPEFNETITFIGVEPEDLGSSYLYVFILDDDKYGHDFLGGSKLALLPIQNCGPCRMTIPLGSEDLFSFVDSATGPWPNGQILLSLCYNTQKRALIVLLKQCVNLIPMDKNGYSDPFIKLHLKPDTHRKKYKTSVKWRNLNPVFNDEFSFDARPNDLDKQSLMITVWDKDIGKSNDFLGSLILGCNSKGKRLKQWKDCLRLPDQYHEQWHCLSSDMITN